jgi:hypothetical protein
VESVILVVRGFVVHYEVGHQILKPQMGYHVRYIEIYRKLLKFIVRQPTLVDDTNIKFIVRQPTLVDDTNIILNFKTIKYIGGPYVDYIV